MMTPGEAAALLDGDVVVTIDPATKASVEAHLIDCAVCSDELKALQSVLADARALPRSVMPARDLFPAIEARLSPISRLSTRYRVPLLAAAAVLLLLGG